MLFQQLFDLTDLIVNRGLPLLDVTRLLTLGLPETLPLSVPMALVFAVLMVYGRMAANHELEAMRLAGYSLPRLLVPVLLLGMALTIGLLGLQQWGIPHLAELRERQLAALEVENPADLIRPNTYQTVGPFTIYAERVDGRDMNGIHIIDERGERPRYVHSQAGRWLDSEPGSFRLELTDGTVHEGATGDYRILDFQRQVLEMEWTRQEADVEREVGQLSLVELGNRYERLRFEQSAPDEDDREILLSIHRTLAFPLACFFLIWVAAPLGMLARKSGASLGFAMTLGVVFVYYLIYALGEPLMSGVGLMPELVAWMPNLTAGVVGGFLLWRLEKQ